MSVGVRWGVVEAGECGGEYALGGSRCSERGGEGDGGGACRATFLRDVGAGAADGVYAGGGTNDAFAR